MHQQECKKVKKYPNPIDMVVHSTWATRVNNNGFDKTRLGAQSGARRQFGLWRHTRQQQSRGESKTINNTKYKNKR